MRDANWDDLKFVAEEARADAAFAPVAVSDAETLLACIRAGAGRGFLPAFVGYRDPSLRCVGDAPRRARELWLIVYPAQRRFPRVGAVVEGAETAIADVVG